MMQALLLKHTLQDAVTLFVVIDPIGLVPLFIAITRNEASASRRQLALLGILLSTFILVGFIIVGQFLLSALEIGLEAFRIAGGVILLIIGLQMVLGQEINSEPTDLDQKPTIAERAVFPLAMPFIAGPGAIMTVVLLTDNSKFTLLEQVSTTGSLLVVLLITYLLLLAAEGIQRLLGNTGINVVARILGLLLAALAIETILTGIRDYFGI